MVEIRNSEELRDWLADKDPSWAQAIAARAALRVLPLVGTWRPHPKHQTAFVRLCLDSFRASFISWAARKYPAHEMMAVAASRAFDAFAASPSASNTVLERAFDASLAASRAAALAASRSSSTRAFGLSRADAAAFDTFAVARATVARAATASAATASAAVSDAALASRAASRAAAAFFPGDSLWASVSSDAELLANHTGQNAAQFLVGVPLWLDDQTERSGGRVPEWVDEALLSLRNNELLEKATFAPWLNWYRVLLGRNAQHAASYFGEKLDLRIARQRDKWWSRDPAKVNADIAGWIPPPVRPTIRQFILDTLEQRGVEMTLQEILFAFEDANYDVIPKTVRGQLSLLASEGGIVRIRTGVYRHIGSAIRGPAPATNAPSPFEYGRTAYGSITVVSGGMDRTFVPPPRNPNDGERRVAAARSLAADLAAGIRAQSYQVRNSYCELLERYVRELPSGNEGNVYLADAVMRTLRRDLAAEGSGVDDRFLSRAITLLEAHQALRIYFPELIEFYEDVRTGAISHSLPLDALDKLDEIVREFTPDVFDISVSRSHEQLLATSTAQVIEWPNEKEVESGTPAVLPPDPISNVDPIRAEQQARAGALNRLWGVLRKAEEGSKKIERMEKAVTIYERWIGPVIDFLDKLT